LLELPPPSRWWRAFAGGGVVVAVVASDPFVATQVTGPLTVAIAGTRNRLDIVWVLLAAAGIVLLAPDIGDGLDGARSGCGSGDSARAFHPEGGVRTPPWRSRRTAGPRRRPPCPAPGRPPAPGWGTFAARVGLLGGVGEGPYRRLRGAAACAARLREHRELALLSRQLATIALDAPLDYADGQFLRRRADAEGLLSLCEQLRFGPLTRRRLHAVAGLDYAPATPGA